MASFSRALPQKRNTLFTILRVSIIAFLIIASLGSTSQATANLVTDAREDLQKGSDFKPSSLSATNNNAPQTVTTNAFLTCAGDTSPSSWITTSDSFGIIRQCTLNVPQDGWVFISADSMVTYSDGPYEAAFSLYIDSIHVIDSYRYVNIYGGNAESVAISILKQVTPGSHTFSFQGYRYFGSGTVYLLDPTLTVMYIPAPSATALTCSAASATTWTTTSDTYFEIIRQCTLSIPQDGWVFISADGSLTSISGVSNEYTAYFNIGIDSTDGSTDTDRRVDVFDDSTDGTDRIVAISIRKPITAGSHTFYFLGKRSSGSGTVRVINPTLTVIYVPSPSASVLSCAASGSQDWQTTNTSFSILRQCTLTVPKNSWAFISANGYVSKLNDYYDAWFRIGIDNSTIGDVNSNRRANIELSGGTGFEKSGAITLLRQVTAGTHTFYFLGKIDFGPGTMRVLDSTLTVIVPGAQLFIPVVLR